MQSDVVIGDMPARIATRSVAGGEHSGQALINSEVVLGKVGLEPGMRLADLGCGRTGHFIFSASRIVGDTGIVYAVDLMKDILDSIQSRVRSEGYDNIHTVWSDVERLGYTPIPEQSLDVCFFVNVLSMLSDRAAAFLEASRLLRSGGKLVVIDWSRNLGPLGPVPEKRVSSPVLLPLASAAGLMPLDEFTPGEYHFGTIYTKK